VNVVVGNPSGTPGFGNFLAEENEVMFFPRYFAHERTKALVGV
jgi:hypothetical protein